jgi:hypothetical protein
MTWGAACPGTFPAAAIGTTSPSSRCHPAPLPPRSAGDLHGHAAILVPVGGSPGPHRTSTTTRASKAGGRRGSRSVVRSGARSRGRRWGSLRQRVHLQHEGPVFVRDLKTWYKVAYAQVGIACYIETFIRDITN